MSDPYKQVKGGRLALKGGTLAKTIDKKRKKKKDVKNPNEEKQGKGEGEGEGLELAAAEAGGDQNQPYTIDAAKRMKYEQLFPVEAKKFGYEPKTNLKSVEDALNDRVKKKADRYCK